MTLYTPLWMQAATGDTPPEYGGLTDRQLILSLWDTEGPVWGLGVTQRGAGANMSVDVGPGMAVITGNDVSPQGTYFVSSDATVNVTVPSPPASGSRVHRIQAHVRDCSYDGTLAANTYDWVIELLEDTGSGTPAVDPTAITLAFVTVNAGDVSVTDASITDRRLHALSRPGRARITANSAARSAVPVEAEELWRQDLLTKEIWDTTAWREVPRRDGGGSAWTSYTPTLTATTTSPTPGSGSVVTGAYYQLGKMVTYRATIKFGTSGVAAGSGFYEVSLPVTARTLASSRQQGSATAWDNSTSNFEDGCVFIETGATTKARLSIGGTVVTNAVPWTWAASDQFDFTITYEAA